MFSDECNENKTKTNKLFNITNEKEINEENKHDNVIINNGRYKTILYQQQNYLINSENNCIELHDILEKEKQRCKTESWNKLNRTIKIQKLKNYSEKYGKEHNLNEIEINELYVFFVNSLEKLKLNKSKDVIYDKTKQEIINIPSLFYNVANKNYTFKNIDNKRVSTLKSLTPKIIKKENN